MLTREQYKREATHRDKLAEVGAGDVGEADQVLAELAPIPRLVAAVQERPNLLLHHVVQLVQIHLRLPLHQTKGGGIMTSAPPSSGRSD